MKRVIYDWKTKQPVTIVELRHWQERYLTTTGRVSIPIMRFPVDPWTPQTSDSIAADILHLELEPLRWMDGTKTTMVFTHQPGLAMQLDPELLQGQEKRSEHIAAKLEDQTRGKLDSMRAEAKEILRRLGPQANGRTHG